MRFFERSTRFSPSRFLFAMLMLNVLLCSTWCSAQSIQGSILGTVKDASGALVSDATLVLTNTAEGTSRNGSSGSGGQFQFEDAKAGRYRLEVTRDGFERWSIENIILTARQQLRIDPALATDTSSASAAAVGNDAAAASSTTTTSTTAIPYSVQYSVYIVDVELPLPDDKFKILHTVDQKGLYNTIYGIGYGKGKHPIPNAIEAAAKWIHNDYLGTGSQTKW